MSKKKKQKQEGHINESWLIPYADLLTLLLALFITLFASSQIDQKKFQEIARSFNMALTGGEGVFDFESPIEQKIPPSQSKQEPKQQQNNKEDFFHFIIRVIRVDQSVKSICVICANLWLYFSRSVV